MKIFPPVLSLILFSVVGLAQTATSVETSGFVIAPNRPYLYMRFDHVAKGVRAGQGDSETRYWFQLVNNCRLPVRVRTSGVPNGSPVGEIGLIYDVVEDRNQGVEIRGTTVPTEGDNTVQEPKASKREALQVPIGNVAHLSSAYLIPPQGTLLFSIPSNHLARQWHIEIPYEFGLPLNKGVREENVGGRPRMALVYYELDLPTGVRPEEIKKP